MNIFTNEASQNLRKITDFTEGCVFTEEARLHFTERVTAANYELSWSLFIIHCNVLSVARLCCSCRNLHQATKCRANLLNRRL